MKKNWKHIINIGNCPSIDKLLQYQDGKLSKEESFSIENHLAGCMICSDILGGIAELPSLEVLKKNESEIKNNIHKLLSDDNRTRKIVIYRRLAIAASIVLLISISIFFYQFTSRNENTIVQHIPENKAPTPVKTTENIKEFAFIKPQNRLEKVIEKKQVRSEKAKTKAIQLKIAMAEFTDSASVLQLKTETMASGAGSVTDENQAVVAQANKSEFHTDELSKSSEITSTTQSFAFDSDSNQKPAISEKSADKSFRITYDESYAQKGRSITGKVTDRTGMSMPGVNVYIQGSDLGTVTDIEGRFKINVKQNDKVVTFSFIGYKQERISLGITDTLLVAMNEEASSLDEVVVTGYGRKKSIFARSASKSPEDRSGIEYKKRKESEQQIDSLQNILNTDKINTEVIKLIAEKNIELHEKNNALNKLNNLYSLTTDSVKKKDIEEIINLVRDEKFEKALRKLKNYK
jgi:hypothetical protein